MNPVRRPWIGLDCASRFTQTKPENAISSLTSRLQMLTFPRPANSSANYWVASILHPAENPKLTGSKPLARSLAFSICCAAHFRNERRSASSRSQHQIAMAFDDRHQIIEIGSDAPPQPCRSLHCVVPGAADSSALLCLRSFSFRAGHAPHACVTWATFIGPPPRVRSAGTPNRRFSSASTAFHQRRQMTRNRSQIEEITSAPPATPPARRPGSSVLLARYASVSSYDFKH